MKRALVLLGLMLIASGSVWAVTVPDVVGLTQSAAEDLITTSGLTTGVITTQCDPVIPAGSVISQNPLAGEDVLPGTPVDLVVSTGPTTTVPDVVGLDISSAAAALQAAGLIPDGAVECDNVNPAGTVTAQSPAAGSSVACGSVVFGTISGGPCALVPDVVGKTQAEAEADFAATGIINVSVSTQCDNVVPAGSVISQTPPAGTQIFSEWEVVSIVVSTGPCPVVVPDLFGLTVTQAEDALTSAGLLLGVQTSGCSNLVPAGQVFGQNPGASSVVVAGTAVDINVANGPCATVPGVLGALYLDAVDAITSAGLVLGTVTYQCDNLVSTGAVISQTPPPMSVAEPGSPVDLVLSTGPCPVTVPDVVGLDQAAAEAAITSAGLVVGAVASQCDDVVPVGEVLDQSPAGGASVAPGSAVDITVSSGPCPAVVPDVVGLDQAAAEAAITSAGLVVGTVYSFCSLTVPAGEVFGQLPAAGSLVAPGSAVDITVSTGPCPVTVPNVVNFSQSAATVQIEAVGLVVGTVTTVCSDTIAAGAVISQDPVGGTNVLSGTPVDLVVSTGPCPVTVPDVVGLDQAAAEAAITTVGLVVGTVTSQCDDVVPAGSVISQSPVAGASVAPGSAVDLVVSSGPCNTVVPDVVGLDQAAAEAAITSAGLVVGTVTSQCDDLVPAGAVIAQSPVGGTPASLGSQVDLVVSTGPCVVVVPDVVGLNSLDAENALAAAGLVLGSVTEQCDDVVPAGSVISQNPVGGDTVALGSAVDLVVSSGPCNAVVPEVVGLDQAAAEAAIEAAGLVVGTVTSQCDDVVPAGAVIAQSPVGGTPVTLGTQVDLLVSTGPCPVEVPNVVNQSQAAAEAAIEAAGLVVGSVTTACSNTIAAGNVISQNPAGGSLVAPGTAVDLVVSTGPCLVIVPNVVGQTQAAAQAAIANANLTSTVNLECSDTVPAGQVISQSPVGGTSVVEGTTVTLTVSSGPCPVEVPNVVNVPQAGAEAAIEAAGLVVGSVTTECSDTVPAGNVISQTPAGGSLVAPGSSVNLVVSTGLCPVLVTVPDVVAVQLETALSLLDAAGLLYSTVEVCDDDIPAGTVLSQDPAGGSQVPEGSTVTLTVSSGPCNAIVPDVVGLTLEAAQAALEVYSFNVNVTEACSDTVPTGSVISQNPVGGTQVPEGSTVNLVVSNGPCPVTVPDVTGLDQAAAEAAVVAAGLVVGQVTEQCSDTVPAGSVISQSPVAGASVQPGSAVDLVISSGPCDAVVPDVVGLTQEAAQAALEAANLYIGTISQECSDTVPAGQVISQDPAAGAQVSPGSAVNLVVSAGPAVVPNVVGQAQAAAAAAITAAGLTVGAVQEVNSTQVPAGTVIAQSPAAGATLTCGAAVNLLVSKGAPENVPTNREIMKQIHDQFEELDADGDGKLSLEEALAALPNLPIEIFNLIDADGDGSLTLDELKEYLKISGCFGCIKRLFVKDLLVSAGGDLLLAGLGLALLSAATLRRRS